MTTKLTLILGTALAVFVSINSETLADTRAEALQAGRDDPIHGFDELRFNPDYKGGYRQSTRRSQPPKNDSLGRQYGSGGMINLAPARMYTRSDLQYKYLDVHDQTARRVLNSWYYGGGREVNLTRYRQDPQTGLWYIGRRQVVRVTPVGSNWTSARVLLAPLRLTRH